MPEVMKEGEFLEEAPPPADTVDLSSGRRVGRSLAFLARVLVRLRFAEMLFVVLGHALRIGHPLPETLIRHVRFCSGLHVQVGFNQLTLAIPTSFASGILKPRILRRSAWPKLPAANVRNPMGADVRSPEPCLARRGVLLRTPT